VSTPATVPKRTGIGPHGRTRRRQSPPSKGGASCATAVVFDYTGALLPGGQALIPPATVRPAQAALRAAA
jgi:hypothetical protein